MLYKSLVDRDGNDISLYDATRVPHSDVGKIDLNLLKEKVKLTKCGLIFVKTHERNTNLGLHISDEFYRIAHFNPDGRMTLPTKIHLTSDGIRGHALTASNFIEQDIDGHCNEVHHLEEVCTYKYGRYQANHANNLIWVDKAKHNRYHSKNKFDSNDDVIQELLNHKSAMLNAIGVGKYESQRIGNNTINHVFRIVEDIAHRMVS